MNFNFFSPAVSFWPCPWLLQHYYKGKCILIQPLYFILLTMTLVHWKLPKRNYVSKIRTKSKPIDYYNLEFNLLFSFSTGSSKSTLFTTSLCVKLLCLNLHERFCLYFKYYLTNKGKMSLLCLWTSLWTSF